MKIIPLHPPKNCTVKAATLLAFLRRFDEQIDKTRLQFIRNNPAFQTSGGIVA